ncbi:MAG: glutathione S-transferase family protein [Aliiglaciecola sp.]
MKLYNGLSPNGFRVAAFIKEKGIEIEVETIDVMKGEARAEAHRARNSLGEVPVLALDDGSFLSESVAICRYLEAIYPNNPLMGKSPVEIAKIEMWNRRMEHQIMGPCAQYGSHTIPIFADKIEQVPAYAETQPRAFSKNMQWFDNELADGRTFVAGDFSIADITGMAALMICGFLGELNVPKELSHAQRWVKAVTSRPSFSVFKG